MTGGVGRWCYARTGSGGGEGWEDGEGEGHRAAGARVGDLHHEAQAHHEARVPHWYPNLSLNLFPLFCFVVLKQVRFLVSVDHGVVTLTD